MKKTKGFLCVTKDAQSLTELGGCSDIDFVGEGTDSPAVEYLYSMWQAMTLIPSTWENKGKDKEVKKKERSIVLCVI